MLGLPSTTEVRRRLPKEAFYRNVDVDAATRRDLVDGVESIVVSNSVKPATANVSDGSRVHEILVVSVEPKAGAVPPRVIRLVSGASPNKVVVVDGATGEAWVCERGRLLGPAALERLVLRGRNLDEAWDSTLAQVALGELDGTDVWRRIERSERVAALEAEVASLEARARKERQMARKNELFSQMRAKRDELNEIERGSE